MNQSPATSLFPLLGLLLAGCPSSRPDPSQHDAQSVAVSAAPAPSAPASVAASSAAQSQQPVASAGAIPDDGGYTRGETWATCMNGFRPEATLAVDLIRLGMLCGPYHGMRKLGAPLTGKLVAGKASSHRIEARKGQCFRAFVVAGEPVGGLASRVVTSSGEKLAQASSSARWTVLDQQGAWCVAQDTEVTIELEATSGQGDYAMQVWVLQ